MRRLVSSCLVAALLPAAPAAQRSGPSRPAAAEAYIFPPGVGVLFFYVKPDRIAEFEAVVKRLGEALEASPEAARRQQAASWRVLRSLEPSSDTPLYLFLFDPVVAGADYDPVRILAEAAPAELQALYEQLKDAVVRVERMSLDRVR
jgi:hypothetical protein